MSFLYVIIACVVLVDFVKRRESYDKEEKYLFIFDCILRDCRDACGGERTTALDKFQRDHKRLALDFLRDYIKWLPAPDPPNESKQLVFKALPVGEVLYTITVCTSGIVGMEGWVERIPAGEGKETVAWYVADGRYIASVAAHG